MVIAPINQEAAKLIVAMLATNRPHGQSISPRLHYSKYVRPLTQIQSATGDLASTAHIYAAIVNQAYKLGESADWVERELAFEAMAQKTGHREELLREAVAHEGAGNDDSLDLYNQRLERFAK